MQARSFRFLFRMASPIRRGFFLPFSNKKFTKLIKTFDKNIAQQEKVRCFANKSFTMARILDSLRHMFRNKGNYLRPTYYVGGWDGLTCLPFGELVFHNVVEMLTDLDNDVTFSLVSQRGTMTFAEFVRFFDDEGEAALWHVFRHGFAVIGYKWSSGDEATRYVTEMRLLDPDEWSEVQSEGDTFIKATDEQFRVYVMKSPTFRISGQSDWMLCHPAIKFLDNTLNASNTSVEKLGAFVVASPETGAGAPTPVVLGEKDKKDMEETMSKQYGLLSKQRQVMLLPRGMNFQTISLTNIDNRLTERVRMAVELIADRMKVPASQIAVIDATAGKSLSNGGEVHEGDRLKYKTYERLLNKTFVAFAATLGLQVTYTIYNKPADAVTGQISEQG